METSIIIRHVHPDTLPRLATYPIHLSLVSELMSIQGLFRTQASWLG